MRILLKIHKVFGIILLPLLLLLNSCADSIISVDAFKVNENSMDEYSIFTYYSLPKTVLRIRIPVAVHKMEEGLIAKERESEYVFNSVEEFFGWKKVELPDRVFTIDKKILFEAITLPDQDKRYAIAYKKAKTIGQTLNVTLSKDGLIQSGEFAQESKVYEVAVKSAEIIGDVVGTAKGLDRDHRGIADYRPLIPMNARITKLIKRADELLFIRTGLITNMANGISNPVILQFNLSEIDKQLTDIKNELLGSISKTIHYMTIEIDPEADFESIDLFKIDPVKGIVSNENDKWKDLSEEIRSSDSSDALTLTLKARKLTEPGNVRIPIAEIDTTFDRRGRIVNEAYKTNAFMYYNIPARYELKLLYDKRPLKSISTDKQAEGSDEYHIYFPQLGEVAFLTSEFKEANITYYEDTGGLKSAKVTKSAEFDANKLGSIYSALDSVNNSLQAIKEKEDADPAAVGESLPEIVNEQVIKITIEEQ